MLIFIVGLVFILLCLKFVTSKGRASVAPANARNSSPSDSPPALETLPYTRRTSLLSPAERSFYEVMRRLLPDHTVFAKTRMSDVLSVPKGTDGWQAHFNRIQKKHVDFLICDAGLRPVLAVELDDSSHQRLDRQERDRFVDDAFAAADLPMVHVTARRSYVPDELRAILHAHLPPVVKTLAA